MRRFSHLIASSTLLLAAGCGDGGSDEAEPTPEPFFEVVREAVLTEEAYYLEGQAGVDDLRVDGARLVFTADAAPEGLVPGAVVLGAADGGYVRRVLSVDVADGVVTVDTEIASPGDFFEDLAIRFRPELVEAQALTAEGYATSARAASTSVGLDWSGKNTCYAGGVELTPDRMPELAFSLDVAPIFDAEKVDGEFVLSVGLEGAISADVELSGELEGSLRCTFDTDDWGLAEFPVNTLIPTPIGPLPLVMTFRVGPHSFGELSLSASSDVSMRATAQGSLQLAVDYEWGGDVEARDTGATGSASLEYDFGDDGYALTMTRGGALKAEVELYKTVTITLLAGETTKSSVVASPVSCTVAESEEVSVDVSLGIEAKLPLVPGLSAGGSISHSWPMSTEGPDETPIPGCTPVSGVLAKIAERLECATINPYMQGVRQRHVVYPGSGRVEDSEEIVWFAIQTPNCFGTSYMLEPAISGSSFTLTWHKELNDWVEDWTVVGTLAPDEQSLSRLQLDYEADYPDEYNPQHITAQLVLANIAVEVDNDRVIAFEGTFDSGLEIQTMRFHRTEETWTSSPTGPELYYTEEETIDTCNEDWATTKFELDLRLEDP